MRTTTLFRKLAVVFGTLAAVTSATMLGSAASQRFYDDDPIRVEPATQDASGIKPLEVNLFVDLAANIVRGGKVANPRRAQNVNTIDEVPDSSWFTNRAGARVLIPEDVANGPDTSAGPAAGAWTVTSSKSDGVPDAHRGRGRAALARGARARRLLSHRREQGGVRRADRPHPVRRHASRRSKRPGRARGPPRAPRLRRVRGVAESRGREGNQLARYARDRERPRLRPASPDGLRLGARQRRRWTGGLLGRRRRPDRTARSRQTDRRVRLLHVEGAGELVLRDELGRTPARRQHRLQPGPLETPGSQPGVSSCPPGRSVLGGAEAVGDDAGGAARGRARGRVRRSQRGRLPRARAGRAARRDPSRLSHGDQSDQRPGARRGRDADLY